VDEYIKTRPTRKSRKDGWTEYVINSGQAQILGTEHYKTMGPDTVISEPSRTVSWLGAPLIIRGKVIGVITVQDYHHPGRYGTREQEILDYIATQIAQSVDLTRNRIRLESSLHEREVLLREIHHRVKNNMQIIISLLNLQSRSVPNLEVSEALSEGVNRIRAMSLIHEILYRSKDIGKIGFDEYLAKLISRIKRSQGLGQQITIDVNAAGMALSVDDAVPLALIISELLTNAWKHAFPDGRIGKITISLTMKDAPRAELIFCDDGVGLPETTTKDTMGMELVRDLVEGQLKGTLDVRNQPGACFTIRFDLTSN